MTDRLNALNPSLPADQSHVQGVGRHAHLHRGGHASASQFADFLNEVLHPDAEVRPMTAGDVAPFKDRLVGFDITGHAAAGADAKARVANLAQYLEPSAAHLQQIAAQLGPSAGSMGPDGVTLRLPGDQGAIGVRDQGRGPVWQWMATGTEALHGR